MRSPFLEKLVFGSVATVFAISLASSAGAAMGDCGQPASSGDNPTATDCLFILQASVGGQTCTPECICDPSGDTNVTATDALFCLVAVVGATPLDGCSCATTTVTSVTTTTTTLPATVSVTASLSGDAVPDSTVTASAAIDTTGGCTVQSIGWTQDGGAAAVIADGDTDTAMVMLAGNSVYKAELIHLLQQPPIGQEDLPPNVELPEGEFHSGLQSRFQVIGVNHLALEESGLVELTVTVTADCGVATDTVEIETDVPFHVATSLRNVPIGVPVLLHAKDHVDEDENGLNDETGADVTTYDWALTAAPAGSTAALNDATSQNPDFVPDVVGMYTVTVTDTTQLPGTDVITLEIHAGTWRGVIIGQDADGLPNPDTACTGCHDGSPAEDQFTPWRETGHAAIFSDLIDTNTHYGENCFECHSVGFNKDESAANGGFDDSVDYEDFLSSGLINNPGDNWTEILANFPETASKANIQCENCHGPQTDSGAHMMGTPRVGLSADICATCHGEPLRHARFQQWQLSGHGNYELAIDEAGSGNCSRCHTANGFLEWLPILLDDDPLTDPTASVTVAWTEDEAHPQTCVTCHDPHANGSTSGINTNATVRISGSTPPLIGGFKAVGVGRGAICMTCHNSRRGLHNDTLFGEIAGTSDTSRAPHGSAQSDMLMGQNAYFVNTGIRGNHSLVEDTCVNCHMEQTPPPAALSYALGGTNHTFAASDQICSNCHGLSFNAAGVQEAFAASIDDLKVLVEIALLSLMEDEIALGNVIAIDLGGGMERIVTDIMEIDTIEFGETRGRQAISFNFVDMTTVGLTGVNGIDVRDGLMTMDCPGLAARCELYDFADDRLVKAGWNYVLVHNDGSGGIHNPAYALEVLDVSRDALEALLAEP